jgi:hypothetical protein
MVAGFAVGSLLLTAAFAPGVYALWNTQTPMPPVAVGLGQIYAAVAQDDGQGGTRVDAAGADDSADLIITPENVEQAAEGSGLAIPFTVRLRGAGHSGVGYFFTFFPAESNSLLWASQFFLFPNKGSCSANQIPADAFGVMPFDYVTVGTFPGPPPDTVGTAVFEASWCLVMRAPPLETTVLQETARVEGYGPNGGLVTDQDTWSGGMTSSKLDNSSNYSIYLEPVPIRPGDKPFPPPTVS